MSGEIELIGQATKIGGVAAGVAVAALYGCIYLWRLLRGSEKERDVERQAKLAQLESDRAVLEREKTALHAARLQDRDQCSQREVALIERANEALAQEMQKQRSALDGAAVAMRDLANTGEQVTRIVAELRVQVADQGKEIAALKMELTRFAATKGR